MVLLQKITGFRLGNLRIKWQHFYGHLKNMSYGLVLVPLAIVTLGPWEFHSSNIKYNFDSAYTPLAHFYFANGHPWGTTTVHTSGVLGFLRYQFYNPLTFPLYAIMHFMLASMIAWVLLREWCKASKTRRIITVGVGVFILLILGTNTDARWLFLFFAAVFAIPDFRSQRSTTFFFALVMYMGFASHVKGTFLFASLAVIMTVSALELQARRFPIHVVFYGVSLLGTLVLAGVNPSEWYDQVLHVLQSPEPYALTFSSCNSLWKHAIFLVSSLFALIASIAMIRRDSYVVGAARTLLYGALLWLVYKAGFTRCDSSHVIAATTTVASLIPLSFLSLAWRSGIVHNTNDKIVRNRAKRIWVLASVVAIAGAVGIMVADQGKSGVWRLVRTPFSNAMLMFQNGVRYQSRIIQDNMKQIDRTTPVPDEVKGAVAVIGTYQTPIIAHGLEVASLPVIAHYEVWTPRATRKTRNFLSGPDSPKYIFRAASYRSALTETVLASHYVQIGRNRFFRTLRRRNSPLTVKVMSEMKGATSWNSTVKIPERLRAKTLVLRLKMNDRTLGKTISFLFQPPIVKLVLRSKGCKDTFIRLNRLLLDEGVVLAMPWWCKYSHNYNSFHEEFHSPLDHVQRYAESFSVVSSLCGKNASSLFEQKIQYEMMSLQFATRKLVR